MATAKVEGVAPGTSKRTAAELPRSASILSRDIQFDGVK
jgi:hypothetical protein